MTLPLLEIERRFLLDENDVPFARSERQTRIRQGYLAVDHLVPSTVRVRQEGEEYTLTVKSGKGVAKQEVELRISKEDFEKLWANISGRIVEKKRYRIPHEGHIIELDVFRGSLSGVVIAEVEFDTIEEADAFEPPYWFGREITEDPQFTNAWMARNGNPLQTTDGA